MKHSNQSRGVDAPSHAGPARPPRQGIAQTFARGLRTLAWLAFPGLAFHAAAQPPVPPATPPTNQKPGMLPAQNEREEGPFATASLLAEHAAVVPGSVATFAVHFSIAPGWHTYWHGRNDTGFPFKADWKLPPGFEIAGPLEWPAPVRHTMDGDILDHVYEQVATILVPVRVPTSAKPGDTATLAAHLTWLVCKSACVFEEADVTITLPIADPKLAAKPSPDIDAFTATRARFPRPLDPAQEGLRVRAERSNDAAYLVVESTAGPVVEFYPSRESVGTPNIYTDGTTKNGRLRVRLGDPKDAEGRALRVSGVLMVSAAPAGKDKAGNTGAPQATRPQFFRIDLPMPEVKSSGTEPSQP